jgi:hypothetical protein
VEQGLGELAVVGGEENAAGGEIEPPDGVDPPLEAREELAHGRTPLGIAHRRHHTARLVEDDVDEHLGDDALAVHLDLVSPRVGLGAELADDMSVDADPARGDERLGGAARGDAAAREDLLDAFHRAYDRLVTPRNRFRELRRPIFSAALVLTTLATAARAQAAPLVLEGEVPEGGPDHFFVPFEVPAGTQEIEIAHDDLSEANILDWGLDDPSGFRGWGGGNTEPAVVGVQAASRSYVPGPITAGTWRVVVGKAKIVDLPARYRIAIDLRTEATLPPDTRAAYAPPPVRAAEPRWYAGDFHVHSRESGDAVPSLDAIVAFARTRGLDFVEISDHNVVTQTDFFAAAHERAPDFLLLPGIEYTTYAGHANAIGATAWVDHKIGLPGVTIERGLEAIRAQGAIVAVNHPALDIGDLCIGCAWKHDVDPSTLGAVEIATGGLRQGGQIFAQSAIAFWDGLLDRGAKIPAIGGSDDHRAGVPGGSFYSPIGDPTTLVFARELSVTGILEGVKRGATVVKMQGPEDPMVELVAAERRGGSPLASIGDTLGVRSIVLRATVTGGDGHELRLVKNGEPLEAVAVTGDPFVYETIVTPAADGEDRWRAEALVDDKPRTVTSHLWLFTDAAGPSVAADEDSGCGIAPASAGAPAALAFFALAFALGRRRLTRRREAS